MMAARRPVNKLNFLSQMEQKRKIVIQTATEPDEALSTPHFDTEATLAARPVVPLAEPVVQHAQNAYSVSRAEASSSWKRSTIILIVLFAVSIGVVSGLAIGYYQSRSKAPATQPVVSAPAVDEPQQATVQPQHEPKQSARISQQPEEEVVEPESESQAPIALPDTKKDKKDSTDETERKDNRATRDDARRDEERRVPPVVVRQEPADYPIEDEREERRARREERRERRREERRRQREENEDGPVNVPRHVERAQQQINRIRDIFEGRQP